MNNQLKNSTVSPEGMPLANGFKNEKFIPIKAFLIFYVETTQEKIRRLQLPSTIRKTIMKYRKL